MSETVYLFTNTFPYGKGETFLETEIKVLAKTRKVVLIPLYEANNRRELPENVLVEAPILSFNPKNRKQLLLKGLFNFSPACFSFHEFFERKIFKSKTRIWSFFTSLLLIRAMLANKNLLKYIQEKVNGDDVFYFYWGDKSALLILFFKQKFTNRTFVRFHGSDLYLHANDGYIPFRKFLFDAVDFFIPISDNGKNYLQRNYPDISSSQIIVSRLGVSDQGINPVKPKDAVFHVVSCSNIVPVKRIDLLIDALSNISFPIKWTHIGSGVLENELKLKCKNLPDNVVVNWLGHKTNDEVIRFYQEQHVDLFINVSSSEGIPVSIMEAMSFGIPALATDVGGVSELVTNAVGVLIQADATPGQIADEITKISTSPNALIRENARTHWKLYYNSEDNYKKIAELLSAKK